MSPLAWLRSRAIPLTTSALALATLYVMLRLVDLGTQLALLIVLVMALFLLAAAALDYVHLHAFYRALDEVAHGGPGALSRAQELAQPDAPQEHIAYDALEAVRMEASEEAARLRRQVDEHRAYVETWVHEVKTPLAAADLIVENAADPALRPLARELARIDGYVEQALFYARATTVDRDYLVRSCELRPLVTNAVKSRAHALIGAGMAVEMEGLDRTIFADPKWMGFVLGQLIDNAIKYRRDCGQGQDQPRLLFKATALDEGQASERVTLTVRDNGCGISAADIGRIFDKGFTGENGRTHARSTGIGLYLVQQLCQKMGLGVQASSVLGAWTAIDITFPTNRMQLFE